MLLPNPLRKLIFLNILFSGGRLFVGAVSVLYFLSFGLKAEDYVLVKCVQAVIFVVLDIPLGYLMKRIGDYKSIILALILGACGCFGYIQFNSISGFMIAEAFIALSLSIWPVAFTAYSMQIVDEYKDENPGIVEKFFHSGDSLSNIGVLICGTIGGGLYQYSKYLPYYAFLTLYIAAIIFTIILLKSSGKTKTQSTTTPFTLKNYQNYLYITPIVGILILMQFFYQPLLHYWQPLFLEKYDVQSHEMSIIFISYSLAMSLVSWTYSRFTSKSTYRSTYFLSILGCLGSLLYISQKSSPNFIVGVILFSLLFALMNLIQVSGSVHLQNLLKKDDRMIITKYISFLTRLGMILSLGFIHLVLSKNEGSITSLFTIYGTISCTVFILILLVLTIPKFSRTNHVLEY